jgi:hypothetical protein
VKTQHRRAWLSIALALTAAACGEVPPQEQVEDQPASTAQDHTAAEETLKAPPAPVAKPAGPDEAMEETVMDDQPSNAK